MLSMPCSTSHCARSGWSDGPWPQMPTYLPALRQAAIAIDSIAFTASSRSSNVDAIGAAGVAVEAERQLRHVVGADREAVEMLEEPVGEDRVGRDLAHHDDAQAVLAALQAVLRQQLDHLLAPRLSVRTNGIISSTLVSPMSSRTRFIAAHSSAKQSRNSGAM